MSTEDAKGLSNLLSSPPETCAPHTDDLYGLQNRSSSAFHLIMLHDTHTHTHSHIPGLVASEHLMCVKTVVGMGKQESFVLCLGMFGT